MNNTSPTNIGMAITSAIAAQELGFIDESRLYEMLSGICRAIEGLENGTGIFITGTPSKPCGR